MTQQGDQPDAHIVLDDVYRAQMRLDTARGTYCSEKRRFHVPQCEEALGNTEAAVAKLQASS